ncbi:MAG TPA: HD domain-containing phosphohydrolase [Pyrinomonadaceae bacterium]|jgi:putative nucleotidyltransferase with HDIG domain
MAEQRREFKSHFYQALVTSTGLSLWLIAGVSLLLNYQLRDHLIFLAVVPLMIVTGMFPNIFPLPSALKLTQEKVTFTLSDAIVLLVACWYGPAPAIFIAGVEGFVSSRRAIRRLSSNVFSFGMMSLVAAASSVALRGVLLYGFGEAGPGGQHSFSAVAVALLIANLVQIVVNTLLFSVFFALRQGAAALSQWKQNFLWAAPIFLPTSAVASLMYITLQYDMWIMVVSGAPVLIAISFGHRQYRNSVRERITVMEKAHRETIEALAVAINAKDEVTHEHVLRVQIYAAGVARLLGCTEAEIEALRAGALLHDIGKIAVPDYILNKPGKLTAAEFEKMKIHTIVGAQILGRVEFPYPVVPVVRSHHERWDGKGYPDGLKGQEIPLTARILSVVDCFDAVREDRQYRKGMTREEGINLIMQGSGSQYDPRVVGIFVTHLPEFEAEILAHRGVPAPTFGIEPTEQLSERARLVVPASGLAEAVAQRVPGQPEPSSEQQQLALAELGRTVGAARGRDRIIALFTENLGAVVPYDLCLLTLVPPHAEESLVAHAAGEHAASMLGHQVVPGEGVTGWALANRQPFYNADPRLDLPPALAAECGAYRTLAVCPLIHEGELAGAVTLYSASLEAYEPAHQQLLEKAAALAAAALAAELRPLPATLAAPSTAAQNREEPLTSRSVFSSPAMKLTDVVLESELAH